MISEVAANALPVGEAFFSALDGSLAVVGRGVLDAARATEWAHAVLAAEAQWNADFEGEQFSVGRAFYTHLETERAAEYFREAARSDALVERILPGMQAWSRALLARLTGGHSVRRDGWCGPGVHVFPAGGEVAREGGVVHHDHEGLSEAQIARRTRALSLVVMLQPPARGGGLRVYATDCEDRADAGASALIEYGVGDLVAIDSHRVHQIQPFPGRRHRVSITIHAVEVTQGVWESWF